MARLLFHYRITPHTTGLSPSEMMMGRKLRSRLDLLKPDVQQRVIQKQAKQKLDRDKHCKTRNFSEGERVFVKNFGQGERWLSGKIVSQKGPVTFETELDNGRICQWHQDYLRKRSEEEQRVLPQGNSEEEIVWQTVTQNKWTTVTLQNSRDLNLSQTPKDTLNHVRCPPNHFGLEHLVETSADCTSSISYKLSTKNLHCFYTATVFYN